MNVWTRVFLNENAMSFNNNIVCSQLKRKNQSISTQTPPLNSLKKYVFSTYVEYIASYENKLEARFPAAIKIYRVFKIGFQEFFQDFKLFMKIRKKLNLNQRDLQCLTRKELELYHKMPRDMFKVAPVLFVSTLPFANYVIFPLAFLLPKQLLCRHFWTIQQKVEFAVMDQKKKLGYYKPVLRALQAKVHLLKDHTLYPNWRHCITQLGSGLHPTFDHIHNNQILFCADGPYDLKNLASSHLRALLKMHNMHAGLRRRKRLTERARLIHLMDKAIMKEGGVYAMSQEDIRWACFLRGLNPTNMNSEETVRWLDSWIKVSAKMQGECWSYILHLPILMAYNHPSNWVLTH